MIPKPYKIGQTPDPLEAEGSWILDKLAKYGEVQPLCADRQGLGTRIIAKEVGVARNTVKHALCSEGPPKYGRLSYPSGIASSSVSAISGG